MAALAPPQATPLTPVFVQMASKAAIAKKPTSNVKTVPSVMTTISVTAPKHVSTATASPVPLPTVPAQPLIAMKPPTNANVLVTVVMMVPFVTVPKPVTTAPVQPERRQTVRAQRPLATKAPTDVNAIAPAVTMALFVTASKLVTTAFVGLVSLLTALAPHLIVTTRPTGVSVTATHNVTTARSVMVWKHVTMALARLAAPQLFRKHTLLQ